VSSLSSCAAVAVVLATGASPAVDAAVACFNEHAALLFPGMQCVAYGVGVSGLPRFASVEVSLHVMSRAAFCAMEQVGGGHLHRASASSESELAVAFVRDGDHAVSHLKSVVALLGIAGNHSDVACTAWVAGPLLQQMARVLDADIGHNWSVLPAHSLRSGGSAGGCAAVLSVARCSVHADVNDAAQIAD
jgi:hypothetical protein